MKKITLLLSFLGIILLASAQSKITFEDQALNGSAVIYNGTVSVVANPVTTGINSSAYCLDVVNNGYAPIKFADFNINTGDKTAYPFVTLKFKLAYKAYNGGSDLDYPQIDVFSSAASPTIGNEEKLGSISSTWGTHAADSLIWKQCAFTFSSSLLATIPNGILVLKLAKSKVEYLLDDIEVIPSPIYGTNIVTLYNFEGNAVSDPYTLANIYGSAASGTAVVAADPVTSSAKSLIVSPTAYNNVASFNVTLPAGDLLTNYDRLYFDRYSTAAQYAQAYIAVNSTIIYKDASGYPSQGAGAAWVTKDYELSSSVPASNTFTLNIGYTSMNSGSFFLDNIKLNKKSTVVTELEQNNKANALIIYSDGNNFLLNQMVDKAEVYSLNGQKISSAKNTKNVNVASLSKGIYIIKSFVNNTTYTNKIVK
ncbi:MAG: T9SS type A sorting domain-containing protein [Paludibacter sp.]